MDKKPWGIGIQSPSNTKELIQVIYANDIAIATSGNYLNYVIKNNHVLLYMSLNKYKKIDLINIASKNNIPIKSLKSICSLLFKLTKK